MKQQMDPLQSPLSAAEQAREQVSALVDGQLSGAEFEQALQSLRGNAELRETWHLYHLSGDLLRSGQPGRPGDTGAFISRLRDRLQAEEPQSVPQVPLHVPAQDAANDSQFRWKLLAGLASVAAVTAIVWALGLSGDAAQQQLARGPAPVPAAGADAGVPGTMIRDARLDELLAAHKQFAGNSALQAPAGFLRNATLESSASGR